MDNPWILHFDACVHIEAARQWRKFALDALDAANEHDRRARHLLHEAAHAGRELAARIMPKANRQDRDEWESELWAEIEAEGDARKTEAA